MIRIKKEKKLLGSNDLIKIHVYQELWKFPYSLLLDFLDSILNSPNENKYLCPKAWISTLYIKAKFGENSKSIGQLLSQLRKHAAFKFFYSECSNNMWRYLSYNMKLKPNKNWVHNVTSITLKRVGGKKNWKKKANC